MSGQPPKTGAARRLWELDDDEVDEMFGELDEPEADR